MFQGKKIPALIISVYYLIPTSLKFKSNGTMWDQEKQRCKLINTILEKPKSWFSKFSTLFIANTSLNRDALTLCGCGWWAVSVFKILKIYSLNKIIYSKWQVKSLINRKNESKQNETWIFALHLFCMIM